MFPGAFRSAAWAILLALAPRNYALDVVTPPFASPVAAPLGAEVVFEALATGDSIAYSYDFGDGSPLRGPGSEGRASHRYDRPGRFTVVARIREGSVESRSFTFFVIAHPPLAARRPASSTTILVDSARARVWTVNPDHGTVACLDAKALTRLFEVPVGAGPQTLAQAPDGTLWVANQDDATLSILSPTDGSSVATVKLPFASRPYAVLFAPDGKAAYVSLEAVGRVLKLDPSTRAVVAAAEVGGRPRGLALAEGGSLLASRFLSQEGTAEVTAVNPTTMALDGRIRLAEDMTEDKENQGAGSLNHLAGPAISPDGKWAWVPAKKDNIRRGMARDGRPLTFENTVRAVVARLDLGSGGYGAEAQALRLDVDDSEGGSAVAFGPTGFPAFVAFQGTDKVVARDPWNPTLVISLPGTGAAPRGLVVDSSSGRLFVQAYLDRAVSVYDVADLISGRGTSAVFLKSIPTSAIEPLSEAVLRGKRIFNLASDPRMSRDGYLSCATCHLDGGDDGRVWDFTDRGEGFRNTQSLLGRGGTAYGPLHWSANFDEVQDFEHDIRGPFGGKGFLADVEFLKEGRDKPLGGPKAGLSPELDALAAYVASHSRVPPSPYRAADGSMTPEALAGKAMFHREDVGCAKCHAGPNHTDSRIPGGIRPVPGSARDTVTPEGFLLHDVGTLGPKSGNRLGEPLRGLDTPGLKGLWFSAPYFHDGSAATVEAVIEKSADGKHGNTSGLNAEERKQLAAFLLQLDELDEKGNGGLRVGAPFRLARNWSLTAVPLPTGGWRIEAPGASGAVRLRILDPQGRTLGRTRLSEDMGTKGWVWPGSGAASGVSSQVLYLDACAGSDCASRRLAR